METYLVKGIVKSLSPIVHDQIIGMGEKTKKGEALPFRTMPFIIENEDGDKIAASVPVVSGNSIRGIGRSLLMRHSIEDVLDLDFEEIFPKMTKAQIRYLTMVFYKGGVTPAGSKNDGAVKVGTYKEVQDNIPWLDLLGGVYIVHHFDSSAKIGILVPATEETQDLYTNKFDYRPDLPTLASLKTEVVRHTRKQDAQDAAEFVFDKENDDSSDNKAAAMYFHNVLPAGTEFYTYNVCNTDNEGTALAFKAMFALLKRYSYIGGMTGRGYGHVEFDLEDFDAAKALQDYDKFLIGHKEQIVTAIELMGNEFHYKIEKDKKDDKENDKKAGKKGKKEKKDAE
jgi:hypothetical protein